MRSNDIARLGRHFEVGGHTQDHISLKEIAPHLVESQIRTNKQWLEDILGREVGGFAYVRGHHNHNVRRMVAEAGYRYARTVRNLMSTPGPDRFQIPTTMQIFAHRRTTYLRNYIRGGPTLERTAVLAAVLADAGLATSFSRAAEACARSGGHFHLWGHSWELDEHDLWGELDRLLDRLSQLSPRFVTNVEWCASLLPEAKIPAAAEIVSENLVRPALADGYAAD